MQIPQAEQHPIRVPPLKATECIASRYGLATAGIAVPATMANNFPARTVATIANATSERCTASGAGHPVFSHARLWAVPSEPADGATSKLPIGHQSTKNSSERCRPSLQFRNNLRGGRPASLAAARSSYCPPAPCGLYNAPPPSPSSPILAHITGPPTPPSISDFIVRTVLGRRIASNGTYPALTPYYPTTTLNYPE